MFLQSFFHRLEGSAEKNRVSVDTLFFIALLE